MKQKQKFFVKKWVVTTPEQVFSAAHILMDSPRMVSYLVLRKKIDLILSDPGMMGTERLMRIKAIFQEFQIPADSLLGKTHVDACVKFIDQSLGVSNPDKT